jgi:hypothetical protein
VAQQHGFEPMLGRLESAQGLFPGTAPGTDGCVCHLGDIDGYQSAGAPQAGQLDRITTLGFDPIASLFWPQRGRGGDNPAGVAFLGAVAVEPIPTRTRFIDKHEMFTLGLPFSDKLSNIAWAHAKGLEVADLGGECWGDRSNGYRVFMDLHANGERARLWPG